MIKRRWFTVPRLLVAIVVAISAVAVPVFYSASNPGETVTVLGPWTGQERQDFENVLNRSGIKYVYQGTRALDQVLQADVRKGTPPDIAVVSNPTELEGYFQNHQLQPLDDVLRGQPVDYGPQWKNLVQTPEHQQYALVVKADLKGIFFYDPRALGGHVQPATWDQLVELGKAAAAQGGTPWCMGLGATPASGFPGADWIADIVLHQAGNDSYNSWVNGTLLWHSPQIEQAWKTWGSVLTAAPGPPDKTLQTNFSDAGTPMFANPPGCYFDHEGSFIISNYASHNTQAGTDFDFFPFPAMDAQGTPPWIVAGNFAGMFGHSDAARKLMAFLASPEGQQIWPSSSGGGTFSVDRRVDHGIYPDPVRRHVADSLTGDSVLCFGAPDLMPSQLDTAFDQAALDFASRPQYYLDDQQNLDTLMDGLDRVRQQAYSGRSASSQSIQCGK